MPNITIKRSLNYLWIIRKLNVRINDIEFGQIANNQTKSYKVETGENNIFLSLRGGKSNILKIDVIENSDIKLVVKPSKFDVLTSVLFIILIPFLSIFAALNYSLFLVSIIILLIVFYGVRKLLNVTAFVLTVEKDLS